MSEKALKACADYARINAEIKQLTKEIGEHIGKCPGVNGDLQAAEDSGWYARANKDRTHLKEAYTPDIQGFPPERVFMEDADILEFLGECPHCLAAHTLIQARKSAKKRFAVVKRSIGAIGRTELVREA